MAGQCDELKMANFAEKSLASFTFSPKMFAYFASHKHIKVQHGLYRCFVEFIWMLAARYDDKEWDDNEGFNLYAHCKQLQDVLINLGYDSREVRK